MPNRNVRLGIVTLFSVISSVGFGLTCEQAFREAAKVKQVDRKNSPDGFVNTKAPIITDHGDGTFTVRANDVEQVESVMEFVPEHDRKGYHVTTFLESPGAPRRIVREFHSDTRPRTQKDIRVDLNAALRSKERLAEQVIEFKNNFKVSDENFALALAFSKIHLKGAPPEQQTQFAIDYATIHSDRERIANIVREGRKGFSDEQVSSQLHGDYEDLLDEGGYGKYIDVLEALRSFREHNLGNEADRIVTQIKNDLKRP